MCQNVNDPQLEIDIPGLPPSTNQLYSNSRGRRVLSTEGRSYKRKIAMKIAKELPTAGPFVNADIFCLKISLFFDIYVKTKGAKNRYKKIDISNRVKVLEDAICESFGIDDRQVMELQVCKIQTTGPERTLVILRRLQSDSKQPNSGSSARTTDSE